MKLSKEYPYYLTFAKDFKVDGMIQYIRNGSAIQEHRYPEDVCMQMLKDFLLEVYPSHDLYKLMCAFYEFRCDEFLDKLDIFDLLAWTRFTGKKLPEKYHNKMLISCLTETNHFSQKLSKQYLELIESKFFRLL